MRGPEDAVMWVALKRESGIHVEQFKEELRGKLAAGVAGRAVLLRAGRHHQRGDELRLAHARGGGRQRAGFRRDPPLRGETHGRDGQASRPARSPNRPVARLPDGPGGRRPQESGNRVRHAQRRGQVAGRGHLLQPLHRAELLGRSEDRHRLPGAGGSAAPGRALAQGDQAARLDRRLEDGSRQTATPPARSWFATWPPFPPEPCPAKSTATT